MKFLLATILSACLLAACSAGSTRTGTAATGASGDGNADFLYGRHAGQPMRDAPDSY